MQTISKAWKELVYRTFSFHSGKKNVLTWQKGQGVGVTHDFLRLFSTLINAALMQQGISALNSPEYAGYGMIKF